MRHIKIEEQNEIVKYYSSKRRTTMNIRTEQPILQVKNLHFRYNDEKETLKGVNLDIYEGEKIAVLGSNGAGKSTFFLNINGVLRSSDGQIIYRGKTITKKDMNELRKNVSASQISSPWNLK